MDWSLDERGQCGHEPFYEVVRGGDRYLRIFATPESDVVREGVVEEAGDQNGTGDEGISPDPVTTIREVRHVEVRAVPGRRQVLLVPGETRVAYELRRDQQISVAGSRILELASKRLDEGHGHLASPQGSGGALLGKQLGSLPSELAFVPLENREEEILLAPEIVVDRRPVPDAGLAVDLRLGHPFDAVLGVEPLGHVQNALLRRGVSERCSCLDRGHGSNNTTY